MTANTDQEVLDALLGIRDNYLKDGKLMQKNITDKVGFTIFYRDLNDLEEYIDIYQCKVNLANQKVGRIGWATFYV